MTNDPLAFHPEHDHSGCIEHALAEARDLCAQRNLRFTPIRELVLKTIWQSHKPLGAYDLLPTLSDAGFNSAPPTVYRALEFLQDQGLVHRIASLNAYIGCPHPDEQHQGSFLICKVCDNTVEIATDSISKAIDEQAQAVGFKPEQQAIEVLGLCPRCQANKS